MAVEGVVTVSASLLDASRRRIVVQDATGGIEVLLPKDVTAPGIGARIRVTGSVGTAYGAPRLRATEVDRRGSAHVPAALRIVGPLTTAHTWRLVTVSGRVESVRKLGERWRAEIAVGTQRHVVVAQPGAHIPITALGEGGTAEVVGVVRPANPSASDRRPNILPRSTRDVRRGSAGSGASAADGAAGGRSVPGGDTAATDPMGAATLDGATDADLVDLASLDGSVVRVGGLVVDLGPDGFTLDDGTATGRVILAGAAAEWIDLVEPGDAINVVGRVTALPDGEFAVVVEDPATIALGSALGGADPATTPEPLLAGRFPRRVLGPGGRHRRRLDRSAGGGRGSRRSPCGQPAVAGRDGAPATPCTTPARGPHGRPSGVDRRSGGRRPHRDRPPDEDLRSARAWPEHGSRTAIGPPIRAYARLTRAKTRDYPRPSFAPAKQARA